MQKRLFDVGWSGESMCQACAKEEGTENQEVGHTSGRFQGPRCNGRLSGSCGWSVVQLDDEELGPLHVMYGSMEAEFEVQRTIKRAELTAFLCLLKDVVGPIKVHVDNKGILDGPWRGERKCIDPKPGGADLWITMREELDLQVSKENLVEVEHVKAHRTEKDKK